MAAYQIFNMPSQILGRGLTLKPSWTIAFYLNATSTPTPVYTDHTLTTTHTQPISADSAGVLPVIYLDPSIIYRIRFYDAGGVEQTGSPLDYANDNLLTAASIGGLLWPQTQAEIAASVTPTNYAYSNSPYDARRYGVDTTGTTNTTTALYNFYKVCMQSGEPGYIPPGTYKLTTGILIFDTNQTDKSWPDIFTAGYNAVTFQIDSATATNEPLLKWMGGTAGSATWHGWKGGSHGGVTFTDATGATAALRSAISLQGINGLRLGKMVGSGLRGDLITVPQNLYSGSNPDPYAVSNLQYDMLETSSCVGWIINNLNFVGQDSWQGNALRAVGTTLGGVFGAGSGCKFGELVVANSTGWAFDDGCDAAATGGSPQRNFFKVAELDNVEKGIRLNRTSLTTFEDVRFIHRYHTSPNASTNYYPRTAISISGGTSANVNNVALQVFHRIESGGALADLGALCNFNSSGNIRNVTLDVTYADNGLSGSPTTAQLEAAMFSNLATSAVVKITTNSKAIADSLDKSISFAVASASDTLPNSGYGTTVISFPTQIFSTYSVPYSTSTYKFTAPRRGLYYCVVAVPITFAAAGVRVRLALKAAGTTVCETVGYSYGTNNQTYMCVGTVLLAAGDTVFVVGDQNTATATIAMSPQQANDARFVVTEI